MEKIKAFLKEWAEVLHIPAWTLAIIGVVLALGALGIAVSSVDLGNLTIGPAALVLLAFGTLGVWFAFKVLFGTFTKYVREQIEGLSFKADFIAASPQFRVGIVVASTLGLLLVYAILACAVV